MVDTYHCSYHSRIALDNKALCHNRIRVIGLPSMLCLPATRFEWHIDNLCCKPNRPDNNPVSIVHLRPDSSEAVVAARISPHRRTTTNTSNGPRNSPHFAAASCTFHPGTTFRTHNRHSNGTPPLLSRERHIRYPKDHSICNTMPAGNGFPSPSKIPQVSRPEVHIDH